MPIGDIGVVREDVTFGRTADANISVVERETLAQVRAGDAAAAMSWRLNLRIDLTQVYSRLGS